MRSPFLAFDVYGTLIDTAGIAVQLREGFGDRAAAAAQLWREKQLEYTFRRGLMRRYVDFDTCTAQALDFVLAQMGVEADERTKGSWLEAYRRLPAFPEVRESLAALKAAGMRMIAFSNGTEATVRGLLEHAGVLGYLDKVVSVDSIQTFKPDPAVYELARQAAGGASQDVWLVSGNPFDVLGAKACGLRGVWVRRDQSRVFDPWEFAPDLVISDLRGLCTEIARLPGSN